MEQALKTWRDLYGIEQEAYSQLCNLLQSFGLPIQFAYSPDGSHDRINLSESNMIDQNIPFESVIPSRGYSNQALDAAFGPSVPNTGMSNQLPVAGPFEFPIPREGFSNQGPSVNFFESEIHNEDLSDEGLTVRLFHPSTLNGRFPDQGLSHWHGSTSRLPTGGLDFSDSTHNQYSTQIPRLDNHSTSPESCSTTVEKSHGAALIAVQSIPESSSRLRPCIRCWKRKLRV